MRTEKGIFFIHFLLRSDDVFAFVKLEEKKKEITPCISAVEGERMNIWDAFIQRAFLCMLFVTLMIADL